MIVENRDCSIHADAVSTLADPDVAITLQPSLGSNLNANGATKLRSMEGTAAVRRTSQ